MTIKTIKNEYQLAEDQYLSDIAAKLPEKNGIHLVLAKTGVGKTVHQMRHAHLNKGFVIFPVKAIKAQQESYRDDPKNLDNADLTTKDAIILQIEKLKDFKGLTFSNGALHVDEAQITHAGGFRKEVETLNDLIVSVSQTHPVYLYSAKVMLDLLPFELDSITVVSKPFNRKISVVQLDTTANVKQCTTSIAYCLDEISKDMHQRLGKALPMLTFVQSYRGGKRIKGILDKLGYKSIVIDSKRIALNENGMPLFPTEYRTYKRCIDNNQLGVGGYDIIIATDVLGEGINFYDNICVVGIQAEASKLFQEFGRARKEGEYWLITGKGQDRLIFKDSNLYSQSEETKKIYKIADDSKLAEIKCDWRPGKARDNAILYALYAGELQKGKYAVTTIAELQSLGYEVTNVIDIADSVKDRVKGVEITKKEVINAITQHGCPQWEDTRHPLYHYLLESYGLDQLDPVRDAIEWQTNWNLMELQGYKVDCWYVYKTLSKYGRRWLVYTFAGKNELEETVEQLKTIHELIAQGIAAQKQNFIQQGYSGFVSAEIVEGAADYLWNMAMNKETEPKWWSDENRATRNLLFKLLMGFEVKKYDGQSKWFFPDGKPWWDVKLTTNERKQYNRKIAQVDNSNITRAVFHEATKLTKLDVANIKPKLIKQHIQDIQF